MPDKLGAGIRYGQDLSRVGSGLGRGENRRDKIIGAAWGDTWPAPGSTLDLDFVNNRGWVRGFGQGGVMDAITFTRASSGTYVGPDGLLKGSGGSPGPLGKNPILSPQDFDNAVWSKSNLTVTANATIAPDGTLSADLITETTTNGQHRIEQGAINSDPKIRHEHSVYVKRAAGTRAFQVEIQDGLSNAEQWTFDLENLLFKRTYANNFGFSPSITALDNGWYRITMGSGISNTGTTFRMVFVMATEYASPSNSYTGDGTSGFFIWGAQTEVGSTATEYFPTNVNVPRFDWGSTTQLAQRNKLTDSDTILSKAANAGYPPIGTTLEIGNSTTNSRVSTVIGSIFLKEDSSTGAHERHMYRISSVPVGVYTLSFLVERSGSSRNLTITRRSVGSFLVNYDFDLLTAGSLQGTAISASIQELTSGVYLCSITYDETVSTVGPDIKFALLNGTNSSYTGDNSSGLLIYAAQFESGSTISDYQSVGTQAPLTTPLAANPTVNGLLIEEARTNRALWCRDATSGTGTNMLLGSQSSVIWSAINGTIEPLGQELITSTWSALPAGVTYDSGTFTFDGVTSQTNIVFSTNTPTVATEAGKAYLVSFTIFQNTTRAVGVDVGGTLGDAQIAVGTYTRYIVATNTTGPQIRFRDSVGARTGSVGNITVREVNLTGVLAPDATLTAATATATDANATFIQSVSSQIGVHTFSVWLRRKTGTGNIDITCSSNGTWETQTITTEWARYYVVQTTTIAAITPGIRIVTSGDEVEIWGPQLVPVSVLTDYQPTTTSAVYGWSKSSVALAKDQTGIDGVVNAATSVHGATANAVLIQPVNLTSGARTSSIYLKRLSGVGPVQVTLDGVTWSTVDLSLYEWRRVVLSGTVTNPCVGVKLVTEGDSVAMDYAQIEDGSAVTSPILTTASTTTRSADLPSLPSHFLSTAMHQTEGTFVVDVPAQVRKSGGRLACVYSASNNQRLMDLSLTTTGVVTFSQLSSQFGLNITDNTEFKVGYTVKYGYSAAVARFSNTQQTATITNLGSPITNSNVLGIGFFAGNQLCGCIKRITYYPKSIDETKLSNLVTRV